MYAGFAGRYRSAGVDVIGGQTGLLHLDLMAQRWAIYRSFFERQFLFERAETMVMSSTYQSGVFLKAMQLLLPLGAYHILRNRRTPLTVLVLAGFVSAPLAASLIHEPYTIDRAIVLLPMGALIGAFGIDWLLVERGPLLAWAGRAACAALAVWMTMQFNGFYRDYVADYRARSAFWFNGNHPGAFEAIVWKSPRGDARRIYVSDDLPMVREQWRLYLLGRSRTDLLARTVYFTLQDLHLKDLEPGTMLLTGADDAAERTFLKQSALKPVTHIYEPDGSPSFTLFERTPVSVSYAFDGTYAARVEVSCTPGGGAAACTALPSTAACPSNETIVVVNDLATDKCGYLSQAALGPDGAYRGVSPTYGIPVSGTFAMSGFTLTGAGDSGGNRYHLTIVATKQ